MKTLATAFITTKWRQTNNHALYHFHEKLRYKKVTCISHVQVDLVTTHETWKCLTECDWHWSTPSVIGIPSSISRLLILLSSIYIFFRIRKTHPLRIGALPSILQLNFLFGVRKVLRSHSFPSNSVFFFFHKFRLQCSCCENKQSNTILNQD